MKWLTLALMISALGAGNSPAGEDARRPILPSGDDLGRNPGFEEASGPRPRGLALHAPPAGMTVDWGPHGIGGSKGLLFSSDSADGKDVGFAGVNGVLRNLKPSRPVLITVWIRLTSFEGQAILWARCDGEKGPERRSTAYRNSTQAGYAPRGTTLWSPLTIEVTPSAETKQVVYGFLVKGKGRVQVDELHAIVKAESPAPTAKPRPLPKAGPGLYRVTGRTSPFGKKKTDRLRVHIPMPILWRDQVPIDFTFQTEPASAGRLVKVFRTPEGQHVAEAVITGFEPGKAMVVTWEALVLAMPHTPSPIPKGVALPIAEVPKDVAGWLTPTWCCDAADPAIRKEAEALLAAGPVAHQAIPNMLVRMKEIFRAAKGRLPALTAVHALTKRGSCTSCANLGAALLRAMGIPARIVAGYPTWSGPLQTHYVVEYWLPRGGWRLLESTLCKDDRPGYEQIEVALVSIENEGEKRAGRRVGGYGGVPYLSLTEYPDHAKNTDAGVWLVGAIKGKPGCDHKAELVALYDGGSALWPDAVKQLSARWRTLTAAAVADPKLIEGLAPRPGSAAARTLPGLLVALGLIEKIR